MSNIEIYVKKIIKCKRANSKEVYRRLFKYHSYCAPIMSTRVSLNKVAINIVAEWGNYSLRKKMKFLNRGIF